MIRLFFAVDPNELLRARLAVLVEELRLAAEARGSRVQWVTPERCHITLKFLGPADPGRLPAIETVAQTVAGEFDPFEVLADELGSFPPEARTPRVFWVGVRDPTGRLAALAARLEAEMEKLGFPKEERGFSPHLTLGRFTAGKPFADWRDQARAESVPESEPFAIREIMLYRSHTLPAGPVYEAVKRFPLRGPGS